MDFINAGLLIATAGAAAVAWWQAIAASRDRVDAERARDAALNAQHEANEIAQTANQRAEAANETANRALGLQALIDERDREFRAVEWDADVSGPDDEPANAFILTNTGDTEARSVTVVIRIGLAERETYFLGDISAKASRTIESAALAEWMPGARDHEIVHPGYRVHWSSPLGQVDDIEMRGRDVSDFLTWEERQ